MERPTIGGHIRELAEQTRAEQQPILDAMVQKWARILRLQDWDITIAMVDKRDLSLENVAGEISWNREHQQAEIRIMDPSQRPADMMETDIEETVIHELLHLHACPFDTFEVDSAEYYALELFINRVSQALLKLERSMEGDK